jgi:asparagine synthase (glutamine-hydrolysing)
MRYTKELGAFSHTFHADHLISDSSSAIAIVFNGEIYNFLEIREELLALGYTFSTQSDTEVILASYLQR